MSELVPKIYVVDDDDSVREAVGSLIRSAGFNVLSFSSAEAVWNRARMEPPSCMVLDVDLPGLSGLDLQQRLSKARLPIPIIFLTGKGDIPMSVRAIKAGAVEFLTKPFADEYLLGAIRESVATQRPSAEDEDADEVNWSVDSAEIEPDAPGLSMPSRRRTARSAPKREGIVGQSAGLKAVMVRAEKVAPTDSTVLITGETGTGKELLAKAIHNQSRRSNRPFIAVNCGAIPQALIASELFGHEKGAFTGALQRRLGRFELAQGGTIFLDEIGELPPEVQVALLRVLQEREFERVGGSEMIRADVRIIAATQRDLQAAIGASKFRSDLFYRLNVFPIAIPPLRDRRDDIVPLVDYFVERFSCLSPQGIERIDPASLKLLQGYSWPGNIRELQNVIERSIITCESTTLSIDESCLRNDGGSSPPRTQFLADTLANQEKEMIEQALSECKGRVAGPWGAAAKLGMPPSTLDSKIAALKIDKHRFKSPDWSETAAVPAD